MGHIVYLSIIVGMSVAIFAQAPRTDKEAMYQIDTDIDRCEEKWKHCSLQTTVVNGIILYQVLPNKD